MTYVEFLAKRIGEPSHGTSYGHHFIQAFNQNKFHFFLKYVLGFESKWTAPALVFGGVIHDCAEAWWTCEDGKSGKALTTVFNGLMEARRKEYRDPDKYREDLDRGLRMLYCWANEWGEADRAEFDVIECEIEHEIPLANGFPITVRLDAALREKSTGYIILNEMKTTSYSVKAMFDSVQEQDQSTTYLWAAEKLWPGETVIGIRPDILYSKGNVTKAERPGYVVRTPYSIWRHEANLIGLYQDLVTRLEALQAGIQPEFLFPRNGKDTAYFSDEYGPLDWDQPDPKFVPDGFRCDREKARLHMKELLAKWKACETIDWRKVV